MAGYKGFSMSNNGKKTFYDRKTIERKGHNTSDFQKKNSSGEMQAYVPPGNGDKSGEYR